MDIYNDNRDYTNQDIPKVTKPQQNNSLFVIDSDEIFDDVYNQTTTKSPIEKDFSPITLESKLTCGKSDSDKDHNKMDDERALKSPIDTGRSLIDDIPRDKPIHLSSFSHPGEGLSIIDEVLMDVEKNKKRLIDNDEVSEVSDDRKSIQPQPSNGPIAMDLELGGDLSNRNQPITHQAKKRRSNSDLEKRKPFTTISDSTVEQECMEIDDPISDSEQISEESESEEEKKVKKSATQSRLSLDEKDEILKMRFLLSNFSDEQHDRYEKYKRSAFPRIKIKAVVESIVGQSVSRNVVIAMAGIAKSYVGSIIEKSLDVKEKQGTEGPLHPRQIREAVRQLRKQGDI